MISRSAQSVVAMISACSIWGLSPVYYKLLSHMPAIDVLSHRLIWSLVFFGIVLGVQGRLREVISAMNTPRAFLLVAAASLMIAANWSLFIWSVQTGQTTQTSLGYYIYPLLAVVIGQVFFGEKLTFVQWLAIGLAAGAVCVLAFGQGKMPWIALVLAVTFGLYGVIKKRLDVGPVVSVTAEVLLLAPLVAIILLQTYHNGAPVFGGDLQSSILLILSGPLTAAPLILFSFAARGLAMTTLGLLQYINPTFQFACAVFVFAEPFGHWQLVAFMLIWFGLALYSASAVRQDKARRKAAQAEALSGTTL